MRRNSVEKELKKGKSWTMSKHGSIALANLNELDHLPECTSNDLIGRKCDCGLFSSRDFLKRAISHFLASS